MGSRVGIGATAAAAVVFSLLLLSDVVLFTASESRAGLYYLASEEAAARDESRAMVAAAATNLLLGAERFVGSAPLECGTALSSVSSAFAGLTNELSAGNLTVAAHGGGVVDVRQTDNVSALVPFNGSIPGDLNLDFVVHVRGGTPGRVVIDKTETHFMHLDARLEGAVSICADTVRAIAESIDSASVACSESGVGPVLMHAMAEMSTTAADEGLDLSAQYSVTGEAPCTVDFQVAVGQSGIPGISGPFSFSVQEEGSGSFVPAGPPQPG